MKSDIAFLKDVKNIPGNIFTCNSSIKQNLLDRTRLQVVGFVTNNTLHFKRLYGPNKWNSNTRSSGWPYRAANNMQMSVRIETQLRNRGRGQRKEKVVSFITMPTARHMRCRCSCFST